MNEGDNCQIDLQPKMRQMISNMYAKLEASDPSLHGQIREKANTTIISALCYSLRIREDMQEFHA